MKPVKGLKTTKKTIAKSLADLPATIAESPKAEVSKPELQAARPAAKPAVLAVAASIPKPEVQAAKPIKPAVPTTTASSGSARNGAKPVTIEAKIDVGFGNMLYLRGEGLGLSWSQGVPLTCVDGKTWKWTGETTGQLKFKLLINDEVWSQGEDLVATPGQKLEISPAF